MQELSSYFITSWLLIYFLNYNLPHFAISRGLAEVNASAVAAIINIGRYRIKSRYFTVPH